MKQYLDVLQKILDEGVEKESGRANMPNTIGISKADISMDLSQGFPLLTTKRMYWKGIVHELLWFLRGETNIRYLVNNNVNIWNGDAYRWYLKWWNESGVEQGGLRKLETIDEFIEQVKQESNCEYPWIAGGKDYVVGDLGKVYGHQWRNQNGVDQLQEIMDGLKKNPYSRYHILDGWNKADFPDMALPPCHLLYQFIVRPLSTEDRWDLFQNVEWNTPLNMKDTSDETLHNVCDQYNIPRFYLDLNMYQRSCDTFLGVPFNIASMSLLLMLFAEANNMIAGVANWIGGDTHLYVNHLDAVREQLSRTPTKLPTMSINRRIANLGDICNLTIHDFILKDYEYQDSIKAELFTGLKKK
jgi:thymidylate synthase